MTYGGKITDLQISKDISEDNGLGYIREQLKFLIKDNEKLVKELRIIRHNMLNMLHGINSFIELEDWNGLKKYFHDILEDSNRIFDISLSSIDKIKNSLLKELLLRKLKTSSGTSINFKVIAEENILIGNDLIHENDLCTIVEEFLDNAMEAALECSTKKVSVYILSNEHSISIIIENTFKDKPNIPTLNIDHRPKVEGTDQGLQSISAILSKYPNILNNCFVQHQVFVQELNIMK